MQESIEYDAALAAGLLTLEVYDRNPGSPKYELLGQIVFVVLEAIHEVIRRREDDSPILCVQCHHQIGLSKADADKRVRCPFCGHS